MKIHSIKINYIWWISLLCSLIFHGLFIYWFILTDSILLNHIQAKERKILVDLDLKTDDHIKTPSKIIANKNLIGKGKLNKTKEEKQHLIGKANSITENTSQNSKFKKIPKKDRKILTKETQKPSQLLAIETENSKDLKFWFNPDDQLQINTETSKNILFYLELKDILQEQFKLYLSSRGNLNYYFVNKDDVSLLASIDKTGNLNFKKMLKVSKMQPYLNYVARSIVDNPNKNLATLPEEFVTNRQQTELGLVFTISFTGHPLRQWWFGFDFIDLNKD